MSEKKIRAKELTDEALENVAGGDGVSGMVCPICHGTDFRNEIGGMCGFAIVCNGCNHVM